MAGMATVLADCLQAFLEGKETLEACIERHPEHRDELAALFLVVRSLPRLPEEAEPSPDWRQRTRTTLLAQIGGGEAGGPLRRN